MKFRLNPVNAFRLFVIICLLLSAAALPASRPAAVYARALQQEETPPPAETPEPEPTAAPTETPTPDPTQEPTPTPVETEEPIETPEPEITLTPEPEITETVELELTLTPEPELTEDTEEEVIALNTGICASVTQISTAECQALVDLYTSTKGANWRIKTGWLTNTSVCNWYGVQCASLPGTPPSTVVAINLNLTNSNNLVGPIPASIGALTNLTVLNLSNNKINGSIPPEIGNLTKLTRLELQSNSLTGGLPASMGNLTNLTFLRLENNSLSGPLPDWIGNLTQLTELWLNKNNFSGPLPATINKLEKVWRFWIQDNQFSGAIPDGIGGMKNLSDFHATNNLFTSLPGSIANTSISELRIANNLLASIPASYGGRNIKVVNLSNNAITGAIPSAFGGMTALEILHLSNNQFEGSIPVSLNNATNLRFLRLDGNRLNGTIPTLNNLKKLEVLFLHNNQLHGTWPVWLQELPALLALNLSNNDLEGKVVALGGPLPPEIGNLTNLRLLDISRNHFWGDIPTSITKLTKLNTSSAILTAYGIRPYTDIGRNHLRSTNTAVRNFLAAKDSDWEKTQTPANPIPVIQAFHPPSIAPQDSDLVLQVRGRNMMNGAVVYINDEPVSTTHINNWTLQVTLPGSMLGSEGAIDVKVENPFPSTGLSAGVNFYISRLFPADGSTVQSRRPYFLWAPTDGADLYQLQFSLTNTFGTLLFSVTSPTNSLDLPRDLPLNRLVYWRVRARVGGDYQGWSETHQFRSANPPGVPSLSAPANNALTTNYKPKLTWGSISLPSNTTFEQYEVQISPDPTFADLNTLFIKYITKRATLSYTVDPSELVMQPNTVYYWRVRAYNTLSQRSNWSAVRTIRAAMLPPVLTTPVVNSTATTPRPTMQWQRVVGATGYTIQFSLYSNFSELLFSATVKPADLSANPVSYTPTRSLPQKRVIYWRVRATGPNGPSLWSSKTDGKFNSANPPSTPSLSSPANNGLVTNYSGDKLLQLKWSTSSLPTGTTFLRYELQVSRSNTFPDGDRQDYVVNNRSTPAYTLPPLDPNTRYYWRVRAINQVGGAEHISIWSAVRNFRTAMRPVTNPTVTNPQTPRPTFSWTAPALHPTTPPTSVRNYTIQFSLSSSFGTLLSTSNTAGTSFTPGADLPKNRTIWWRVRANGDFGPTLWVSSSFLSANSPSTPALASPANNTLFIVTEPDRPLPLLKWNPSTLPSGTVFKYYQVQIATDSAFTALVRTHTSALNDIRDTSYQVLGSDLQPNTRYYWRVRAENESGEYSTWSAARYFRVAMPAPVSLNIISPTHLTRRPTFQWTAVPGATNYTVQLSLFENFSTLLGSATPATTAWTSSVTLPQNRTIWWRVRANGANGPSPWSIPQSFTSANPPSTPSLVSPASGTVLKTRTPALDWSNSSVPAETSFKQYVVEVSVNRAFPDDPSLTFRYILEVYDRTQSNYTTGTLAAGKTYYWRVRAVNTSDEMSLWSSTWSFKTGP